MKKRYLILITIVFSLAAYLLIKNEKKLLIADSKQESVKDKDLIPVKTKEKKTSLTKEMAPSPSRNEKDKLEIETISTQFKRYIENNLSDPVRFNEKPYRIVRGIFAENSHNLNMTPLARLYGYSIFKTEEASEQIMDNEYAIVVNDISGAIGILTGKLIINTTLTNNFNEIAADYNLNISYQNDRTHTMIVKVNQDLPKAYLIIKNDPRIVEVKIEIIESAAVPK